MKSKWTILSLVGALSLCLIHASLAEVPGRPGSADDDAYSSHLGDLNKGRSTTDPQASRRRVGNAVASPAEEAASDPTTYAARLDDTSFPEPISVDPGAWNAGTGEVAIEPESDDEAWSLPVPDPGDPIDRFVSLANVLFTSGLDGGKGKGKGCFEGCEQYCGCPSCQRCLIYNRTFGSIEYMHMWSKGRSLPPLVTTDSPTTPINSGPPDFTPIALTLNSPTGQLLLGNDNAGGDRQAAGRLTAGWWLDDCGTRAVGFKLYGNEGAAFMRNYSSSGDTPLGRPFFNSDPLVAAQDALLVAHPQLNRSGSIGVRDEGEFLGAEAFYRMMFDSGRNYRVDLIGGYRFNRIDNDLLISTTISDNVGSNQFGLLDQFNTSNEYHGGDLGLYGEWYHGCWTLSMLGKIGVGNMHQRVAISGVNVVNNTFVTPGGLLTQPTNIGLYKRDVLVWSPEANVKLSYAFSDRFSVTVGYTFMYWTRAVMAGDHIDFNVNATQLTGGTLIGPPNPRFAFHDTDYWVQSVDIGASWNY